MPASPRHFSPRLLALPLAVLFVLALATLLLIAAPPAAVAGDTAPEGAKALLQITIDIAGGAKAANKNGEHHNWSTKRSLSFETVLVAQKASADSPGGPGMPAVATALPADQSLTPSASMEAMGKEIEKCGEDTACQMKLAMKMAQSPQVQADMQKAKGMASAAQKSQARKTRYQVWTTTATPSTGTLTIEDNSDELFKTAVVEKSTCKMTARHKIEDIFPSGGLPGTLTLDVETGAFSLTSFANRLAVTADTACVRMDGKVRSEEREQHPVKLLPEAFTPAGTDPGVFTGTSGAAQGGQQLVRGSKVLTGSYGKLKIDNLPETATITVRWTVTRKS